MKEQLNLETLVDIKRDYGDNTYTLIFQPNSTTEVHVVVYLYNNLQAFNNEVKYFCDEENLKRALDQVDEEDIEIKTIEKPSEDKPIIDNNNDDVPVIIHIIDFILDIGTLAFVVIFAIPMLFVWLIQGGKR